MNREELIKFHMDTCTKLNEVVKKKNADYAGSDGDAFNNFTRIERLSRKTTTEQGFLVRMSDKFGRLTSFIEGNELLVKDEAVEDTLDDLANYCILMKAYLKHKRDTTKVPVPFPKSVHRCYACADMLIPYHQPNKQVAYYCECGAE